MKEISDLVRENQKLDLRVKDLEANQSLDLKTRKELIALNEQVAYLRRQRDYAEKVLGEVRRALDL
jgi:cupin superfamily acireductone dioxygenase involved in methionine salvage